MTTGGTPTGFNISDFITRVIPGGILVSSIAFSAIGTDLLRIGFISGKHVITFAILSFVIVAILSFVIGEFINTFRISIFDIPNHFRRALYAESESEQYLGNIDSILWRIDPESMKGYSLFVHSDKNIIATLRSRFDLDDNFDGAHNFYTLLTSDLSSGKRQETIRLENIYIFYANVKVSLLMSILWSFLYTVAILFDITTQTTLDIALGLLIIYLLIFLSYLLILSLKLVAPIDRVYVESLLSDYFTYVHGGD